MILDGLGMEGSRGTSTASATSTNTQDNLGRDEFLTLLVAQLENQDPLNPLESTEFTSQLAQYSSLEQLFNVNGTLLEIKEGLDVQSSGDVLKYLGKEVTSDENAISLVNGLAGEGGYSLEERGEVMVVVYDAGGEEVQRIYEGWKDPGTHAFQWNGEDQDGHALQDGLYAFQAMAADEAGGEVAVSTRMTGKITGIQYVGGQPTLMMGDRAIQPSGIVEVRTAD